jgi:hypothetical protein
MLVVAGLGSPVLLRYCDHLDCSMLPVIPDFGWFLVEMVRALLCFPLLWSAVPQIILLALLALVVVEAS